MANQDEGKHVKSFKLNLISVAIIVSFMNGNILFARDTDLPAKHSLMNIIDLIKDDPFRWYEDSEGNLQFRNKSAFMQAKLMQWIRHSSDSAKVEISHKNNDNVVLIHFQLLPFSELFEKLKLSNKPLSFINRLFASQKQIQEYKLWEAWLKYERIYKIYEGTKLFLTVQSENTPSSSWGPVSHEVILRVAEDTPKKWMNEDFKFAVYTVGGEVADSIYAIFDQILEHQCSSTFQNKNSLSSP